MRGLHRGDHNHRRKAIGQNVLEQNTGVRKIKRGRSFNIFLAPLDQRCRARGARVIRPLNDDEGQNNPVHALAKQGHENQRHQNGRQ